MPDLVVHLRKPNDWAKPVRIHYWNTWPEQHQTTWPGVPMTVEADEWFVFRFEAVSSANLLFTDGHERQTNDLWRDREGWFRNGRWYDENPDLAGAAAQAGGRPGGAASRPAPPPADATRGAVPAVSGSRGIGSPDFREETIYFLMTTRFYDGDPSNNFFCRDRIKFDAAGQPEDPHWRGDFKGLIDRLDYVRDLGFTAIWITPPVENRSGLDYHGYHPYDWTRIDPRLESPDASYQNLIEAAHARGIKSSRMS